MPKLLPSDKPFTDCRVYGPYGTKRRIAVIVRADGSKTTMSFARYLMCIQEKRWLAPNEEVDHVDDNRLNDTIGNLQILTSPQNRVKYERTLSKTMVSLVCPGCGCSFERERRQTHLVKGGTRTFCSRSCSGGASRRGS